MGKKSKRKARKDSAELPQLKRTDARGKPVSDWSIGLLAGGNYEPSVIPISDTGGAPVFTGEFDAMWTIKTQGLLALQSWTMICGVIVGWLFTRALDVVMAHIYNIHGFSFEVMIAAPLVASSYDLPIWSSTFRFLRWLTASENAISCDAPVAMRLLAVAYESCCVVGPYLLGTADLAFWGKNRGSLFICFVLLLWRNVAGLHATFLFAVPSLLLSLSGYGGLALAFFVVLRLIDVFAPERSLLERLRPGERYLWTVKRGMRWQKNADRAKRLAYWHTYFRDRGDDAAEKILEKSERRMCDVCGRQGAVRGPRYAECGACGQRRYCSVKCQRKDWEAGHAKLCGTDKAHLDPYYEFVKQNIDDVGLDETGGTSIQFKYAVRVPK